MDESTRTAFTCRLSVLSVLGVLIGLSVLIVHIVLIEKKEVSGRKPD